MKKKIIVSMVMLVLMLTAVLLVACDGETNKPGGKEVEIVNPLESFNASARHYAPLGTLSPYSEIYQDQNPEDLYGDSMESRMYEQISFFWDRSVTDKYKITKITFDFWTSCEENFFEMNYLTTGKNGTFSEDMYKVLAFIRNEAVANELVFEQPIDTTTKNSNWQFWILPNKQEYPELVETYWKISNLKVYGIKK